MQCDAMMRGRPRGPNVCWTSEPASLSTTDFCIPQRPWRGTTWMVNRVPPAQPQRTHRRTRAGGRGTEPGERDGRRWDGGQGQRQNREIDATGARGLGVRAGENNYRRPSAHPWPVHTNTTINSAAVARFDPPRPDLASARPSCIIEGFRPTPSVDWRVSDGLGRASRRRASCDDGAKARRGAARASTTVGVIDEALETTSSSEEALQAKGLRSVAAPSRCAPAAPVCSACPCISALAPG